MVHLFSRWGLLLCLDGVDRWFGFRGVGVRDYGAGALLVDDDLVRGIIMYGFDLSEPWFSKDDVEGAVAVKDFEPAGGADTAYSDCTEPSSDGFDFGTVGDTDACG
jgi:hypothetical protein